MMTFREMLDRKDITEGINADDFTKLKMDVESKVRTGKTNWTNTPDEMFIECTDVDVADEIMDYLKKSYKDLYKKATQSRNEITIK